MTWDRWLYFLSEGRCAEDFFTLKNPTASARFEPVNLGTKGQHATPRPPKPLNIWNYCHVIASLYHFWQACFYSGTFRLYASNCHKRWANKYMYKCVTISENTNGEICSVYWELVCVQNSFHILDTNMASPLNVSLCGPSNDNLEGIFYHTLHSNIVCLLCVS